MQIFVIEVNVHMGLVYHHEPWINLNLSSQTVVEHLSVADLVSVRDFHFEVNSFL